MIIVDTALAKCAAEGKPVRVAMTGAGYMSRGIALQIISSMPGMRLVAIANRTKSEAERAYREAGVSNVYEVTTAPELDDAIERGDYAVTENPDVLTDAKSVQAVLEATGEVEYGARITLRAIERGKHVILMNAELDATLGPILAIHARRNGVVFTNTDGDQPGEVMNLCRFVRTIGCRPVLAGNIKGLIDPYRNPATQARFAAANKQKPKMITSFADGTKIAMEMAVVANATGFKCGKRGMYGPSCSHANDAAKLFPAEEMLDTGLVDYILGAEPGPGVFVIGYDEDKSRQQYMNYFKMGDGPFYVFYVPYHLPHLEAPITVARAVLFHDAAITPLAGPVCDVITMAKRDLNAGEELDGIGGFTCYGLLDNVDACRRERLLPMGLAEGCRLTRAVAKDEPISYEHVIVPVGRLCDRLRAEQDEYFWAEQSPLTATV